MNAALLVLLGVVFAAPAHAPPVMQWTPECLIQRGCPNPPAPLPECDKGLKVQTLREAFAAVPGRPVAVFGTLGFGATMTTLVMCDRERRCCNHVRRSLELIDGEYRLPLEGIGCAGDDSMVCCPHPEDAAVVAVGILRKHDGLFAKRSYWTLREATLCKFKGASP